MAKLIAIIDDDEAMQDSLRDLMEAAGLVAQCFGSAEEFLESDLHTRAACLVLDIRMPKMSGLQLQARLKQEGCNVPIIFITASKLKGLRETVTQLGAAAFFEKPYDSDELLRTIARELKGKPACAAAEQVERIQPPSEPPAFESKAVERGPFRW